MAVREFPGRLSATTQPCSRLVDAFCREYKIAFVAAHERESRSGLRLCLSLNGAAGDALHRRFGPSREHVALFRDAAGAVAAGMNFVCFPMAEPGGVMTVHTTYVFVAPAWRGRRMLRGVYDGIEDLARAYARDCGMANDTAVVFIGEQKDPFRMTLADFEAGAGAYGLDAFDRLAMWGQLGARVLLFPYVQPSLSAGGPPDRTLFLRVLLRQAAEGDAAGAFDPRVLRAHLHRFFAISVAKGQYDPDELTEVRDQMHDLEALAERGQGVPTRPMPSSAQLAQWKRATRQALRSHSGCVTIGAMLDIASVHEALSRLRERVG